MYSKLLIQHADVVLMQGNFNCNLMRLTKFIRFLLCVHQAFYANIAHFLLGSIVQ